LINKLDAFKVTVCSLKPDIIGITESWANDSIEDAELSLDGYVMFRCDRSTNNKGGGVLLYVRCDLEPTEFVPNTKFPEHIWCKIKSADGIDVVIGVCYRSNNAAIFGRDSHSLLRSLLSEVSKLNVLIMGDFNYPDVNWAALGTYEGASQETNLFVDCLMDNFFTQHVDQPTRGDTILDLVITAEPDVISEIAILDCLESSDHNMLTWSCQFNKKRVPSGRTKLNFRKANLKELRKGLRDTDWNCLLKGSIDESWNKFRSRILSLSEAYIPKLKVPVDKPPKPPWITNKCLQQIARKRKVFKKFNDKKHPACQEANAAATKCLRKARRRFEKSLAARVKHDKKSFFAYVRSRAKSRVTVGPITNAQGKTLESPEDTVEEFNRYFASVFTEEDADMLPSSGNTFIGLCDINITEEMVKKQLQKLRQDKAGGADDLTPRLLLMIEEEVTYPLWLLFTKSLKEGSVPDDWRKANVTPIYKKGNRNTAENYRPISLTSQCSKMLESIIRDVLAEYLEANHLLRESQHGFRAGKSCLSNILMFLDKVTNWIDQGNAVDVIFLDFAKAFDKVPHKRLLSKLADHGIRGSLLRWIQSWLLNRAQRVCLNGTVSTWRLVLSGVPQGSVLGPILFLIFINDLDIDIQNLLLKFADDTKLCSKVCNAEDIAKLQEDLDTLVRWSQQWQMKFNVQKCKVMHVGYRTTKSRNPADYFMEGHKLESCEQERDLGVIMSANLKVRNQCSQACAKANKMLGIIKRSFVLKSTDVMLNLYKTMVRPHLEYCISAWSPHYVKDKELIEKVQHRFTRMIPGIQHLPYTDRLKQLGLWSLEERRNRADLIEVFKMAHGFSKTPLHALFHVDTTRITRGHCFKLSKYRCNKDVRKFFFSNRVITRWNMLHEDTVITTSINGFKSKLEKERKTRMGLFLD